MQHRNKIKILGRVRNQRIALMRGLARSLVLQEKINTTETKAKALRPFVEKLITRGKVDSVANRRLVAARLGNDQEATKKIFEELAPRYKDRDGGYTRIAKLPQTGAASRKEAVIDFV